MSDISKTLSNYLTRETLKRQKLFSLWFKPFDESSVEIHDPSIKEEELVEKFHANDTLLYVGGYQAVNVLSWAQFILWVALGIVAVASPSATSIATFFAVWLVLHLSKKTMHAYFTFSVLSRSSIHIRTLQLKRALDELDHEMTSNPELGAHAKAFHHRAAKVRIFKGFLAEDFFKDK